MGAIASIDILSIGSSVEILTAKGERAIATGIAGGGGPPPPVPPAPLGPNAFFNVAAWFVAPLTGNDANDGLTALTPVQHYREVVRRWNTVSPVVTNALGITVTFLEDFVDLNDPVVFLPIDPNVFGAKIVAHLGAVSAGVLAGVVPKNRPAGQELQVDLGAAAAGAIGMWLVNTPKGGASFVRAAVAGNVVSMDQPMDTATDVLEVDSYANGDAFTVTRPTQINLVQVNSAVTVLHAWLPATIDGGGLASIQVAGATFQDCRLETPMISTFGLFINCLLINQFLTSASVSAGSAQGCSFEGQSFGANDLTLDGSDFFVDVNPPSGLDFTFIVGTLRIAGSVNQTGGTAFYGVGYSVNVTGQSTLFGYAGTGATAVTAFLGTLTALSFGGQVLGATVDTTTDPPVYRTNIALTPAKLDATLAAGGFDRLAIDNGLLSAQRIFADSTPRQGGTTVSSGGNFGDGLDGAALFDGIGTPAGSVLAAANTYTLSRDVYYSSCTINPGVTVIPANGLVGNNQAFRIFCSSTLTNNGTIAANGQDAALTVAGAGFGDNATPGSILGGSNGGALGAPGTNLTAALGGAGGASIGAGGTVTPPLQGTQPRDAPLALTPQIPIATTNAGGAGGGGGTAVTGGAGGGGAGIALVSCHRLSGAGAIHANGGAGGNAGAGQGGGGGGGGAVLLVYGAIIGWSGVLQALGGAPGTSTAGAATAGAAGAVFQVPG